MAEKQEIFSEKQENINPKPSSRFGFISNWRNSPSTNDTVVDDGWTIIEKPVIEQPRVPEPGKCCFQKECNWDAGWGERKMRVFHVEINVRKSHCKHAEAKAEAIQEKQEK